MVGFGGIPIQGLSFEEAERVLLRAVDRGINFFDSARAYSDSEEKMGRAFRSVRPSILLATKALSRTADEMHEELEKSLRALRTDVIDLYQLHHVGDNEQLEKVLGPGGAYEELDHARAAGKVRSIGITGHSQAVLAKAVETGLFDTVQIPFNAIENQWAEDVIPAAARANAGVIAMKPLAGGALRHASYALRYSLTRGATVVIPGMESVDQVDANAGVGEVLEPLVQDEVLVLEKEKEFWGNRFCRRCAYCMPCPNGLDIPFLMLIESYYTRYDLKQWALDRLSGLEMKYSDCAECAECVEKCPYGLPVPDLMAEAARRVV